MGNRNFLIEHYLMSEQMVSDIATLRRRGQSSCEVMSEALGKRDVENLRHRGETTVDVLARVLRDAVSTLEEEVLAKVYQ